MAKVPKQGLNMMENFITYCVYIADNINYL